MSLGPYASFILTSYALVAAVVLILILAIAIGLVLALPTLVGILGMRP